MDDGPPPANAWRKRFFKEIPPGTHAAAKSPFRHDRGYLPHFDKPGCVQSLTFRLEDAVPLECVEAWRRELDFCEAIAHESDQELTEKQIELRRRIAAYEDAGHGECLLRNPAAAQIVADSLRYFDGERYGMLSWCVMPNHVHVLIETRPAHPVGTVVKSWKTFTYTAIRKTLGREASLWQEDYFDRFIRSARHLQATMEYIENNPVKAGLCGHPEDWLYGSARLRPRNEVG